MSQTETVPAPPLFGLAETIESQRIESVPDVISLMEAIDALLPLSDGLKWFNKLYWMVTEAVFGEVERGGFAEPRFIAALDVEFAKLYFNAVAANERSPGSSARAWRPLFESRMNTSISRVQHALAGMNAHINHDLAIAVVSTCRLMALEPSRGTSQFNDYEKVNEILEHAEGKAISTLATGFLRDVTESLGEIDDKVAMWSIRHARDAAWTNAEVLWAIRGNKTLFGAFTDTLDRFTAFAGRGLLVPTNLGEEFLAR